MKLFVNGQDISRIILGEIGKEPVEMASSPEAFLRSLDTFLREKNQSAFDIEAIYAVIGPGSSTSLRTSLAIINTIGFVQGVPLYGMIKPLEKSDIDLMQEIHSGILLPEVSEMLVPYYEKGPKITASNKDALGRKLTS